MGELHHYADQLLGHGEGDEWHTPRQSLQNPMETPVLLYVREHHDIIFDTY